MLDIVNGYVGIAAGLVSIVADLIKRPSGGVDSSNVRHPRRGISVKAIFRGWISFALLALLLGGVFTAWCLYEAHSQQLALESMTQQETEQFLFRQLISETGIMIALAGMFLVSARATYVAAMQAGGVVRQREVPAKFYRYAHGFFSTGSIWIILSLLSASNVNPAWIGNWNALAPELIKNGEGVALCCGALFGAVMGGED